MELNGNFFYWFIGVIIVSAIVQVSLFLIASRIDKRNKLLHKFYCDFYEYIKDETVITGLCHEMIKFRSLGNDGECMSIFNSKIKNDFYIKHFLKQKPSLFKHISFYLNDCFVGRTYWWNNSNESTKQRKLFIKMLIEKTNSNKNSFYEAI
jgi:hypothetical protein